MNYLKNKISIVLIICMVATSLFSCTKNVKKEKDNTLKETKSSEQSPIINEDWFKNGIHTITNPITNTYMLVNGSGDLILKTNENDMEMVGTVRDINNGTTNYVYKTYMGESIVKSTFSGIDYEYIDYNPSERCRLYDIKGNDIGFEANIFSPSYSSKNKIVYALRYEDVNEENYNNLMVFDVNTKEHTKINYSEISTLSGKFILSTSPYNIKDGRQELVVLDDNFNEIKKIEGYSIDATINEKDYEYIILKKRVSETEDYSKDYKYNFLNSDFNLMLENDVDENVWTGNRSILTLRTGNKVYDYDVKKKERVGSEREYKAEDNTIKDENKIAEEKYINMTNKIQTENVKDGQEIYDYVETFVYDNKVLFIGYLNVEQDIMSYSDRPVDVYDEEGNKIASFDDLSTQYKSDGYLIANHDTVYNINLQVVRKLDNKRNFDRYEKFGRVFFTDEFDVQYEQVDSFTIFDNTFEPVFENVNAAEFNAYDTYISIVDKDGTKIVDKDNNIVKAIDRKILIKNWYDNKTNFREFTDLTTKKMGLIDEQFNYKLDNINFIGFKEEKYFTYQNGFYYGLMDYDGKVVLKYSIFDSMQEDANLNDYKGDFIEY